MGALPSFPRALVYWFAGKLRAILVDSEAHLKRLLPAVLDLIHDLLGTA